MSDEERDEAEEKWNKATRLAVAGAVAPILRQQSERAAKRRVARVDKDGNVVGYTTLAKVQEALLATRAIELAVQEGERPKDALCEVCGKTFAVPRKKGTAPRVCPESVGGCARQTVCPCGCGKTPPVGSFTPAKVRLRKGSEWTCRDEARRRLNVSLLNRRGEMGLKSAAAWTSEKRKAVGAKVSAAAKRQSPADRSARARRAGLLTKRSRAARASGAMEAQALDASRNGANSSK